MKNPEFGGAEVHTPTCDHCHGPIKVVALRGRYGLYCKQACCAAAESNLTEKEKNGIMARKQAEKKTAKTTAKTPKKTSTKKVPARKTLAKAPSTKKVPVEKPAGKQAAADADEKQMFRPGATKYDIWEVLKPGKPMPVAELQKITEDAGKTPQLIGFVLSRVRKEGYTVVRDKEAGTVQVTK